MLVYGPRFVYRYQGVCEEYFYTSVVRTGCVQDPDTNCTDRQTQQCSNSATVLSTVG